MLEPVLLVTSVWNQGFRGDFEPFRDLEIVRLGREVFENYLIFK